MDRYFLVKHGEEAPKFHPINVGVLQGSVLGPLLYRIYVYNIPLQEDGEVAAFADDTVFPSKDAVEVSDQLQSGLDTFRDWIRRWRIKINTSKLVQMTLPLHLYTLMVLHYKIQRPSLELERTYFRGKRVKN